MELAAGGGAGTRTWSVSAGALPGGLTLSAGGVVGGTAEIHVPELLRTAQGNMDLSFRLDRSTFDRLCQPVVDRSINTCKDALDLLDMKPTDLTAIYLSGGTTYIPAVRQGLVNQFGVPVKTGVPPEHAVCIGAGIHAAQLEIQGHATLEARHT